MFAAKHQTEHGEVRKKLEVRAKTEGAEGGCNPIGRTTISTIQTPPPPKLPGTKEPTTEYTWVDPWLQLDM